MGAPFAPPDTISSQFIPPDERLLRPTFTLRDSNMGNIFLSRSAVESDGTIEISAVIDWQHTAVLPLYLTSLIPRFIEDAVAAPGQEEAAFRKEQAYLRKAYHALYQETGIDVVWASALSFGDNFSMSQQLPAAAQFCWHGGYIQLKQRLIRAAAEWEAIAGPGVACPLGSEPFSEEEVKQAKKDELRWIEMEDARADIAQKIGVEPDGWVRTEEYDRAIQVNDDLRKAWLDSVEKDSPNIEGIDPASIWPFQAAPHGT